MLNLDDVTKNIYIYKKKKNSNWPQIPDNPYKIFIVGGFRYGKTNALFNLISHQTVIELYAKDPYEAKYELLINKQESTGLYIVKILKVLLNT